MKLSLYALTLVCVIAAGGAEPPPPTAASPDVASPIRIWGNDQMASLVDRWETGFRRMQPSAHFENRLLGTGTAMAGLYTGVADLAFMGRDATPKEIQAFQWVFRYPPERVDVVTGSRDEPGKSPALVVFVPRDNPLARLSLAQLAAIVACEAPDGRAPIQTWGRLGLPGAWANRAIHVYTFDTETGTGIFLQHVLLQDSRKWAWDRVTEFRDRPGVDGATLSAGRQIVTALATDADGLGLATLGDASTAVRPVPLGIRDDGPFYAPTPDNIISQAYPLARILPVYVNRTPGKPLDPNVAAFLRYIVSPQGQDDVTQAGGYLPLSAAAAAKSRRELE